MEQIESSQNKANASLLGNIDGLIDYIISLFKGISQNGVKVLAGLNLDLISVGLKQYFRLTSAKTTIHNFINKSFPFWDKIFAADESFFLDNAFTIFSEVPDSATYIASITDLFRRRKFNSPLDNVGQILTKEELEEYLRTPKEKRAEVFKSRADRYGQSHVSDEDMEEILQFFKAFIADCLKYIHYARRPYQIIDPNEGGKEGGKVYTFYAFREFPNVDIPFYQNLLKNDYPINLTYFPVSSVQYLQILKEGAVRTLETPIEQNGGLSIAWAKLLSNDYLKKFNISLDETGNLTINNQIVERAVIPPLYHQEVADMLAKVRLERTKEYATVSILTK